MTYSANDLSPTRLQHILGRFRALKPDPHNKLPHLRPTHMGFFLGRTPQKEMTLAPPSPDKANPSPQPPPSKSKGAKVAAFMGATFDLLIAHPTFLGHTAPKPIISSMSIGGLRREPA